MFETDVSGGVLSLSRRGTRWLSTGHDGGIGRADVAYNVSVPEGWDRTDLSDYVDERLDRAGFDREGPSLLTGVSMAHARVARLDPVVACATAGVSNPAALPVDATGSVERVEPPGANESPGDGVQEVPTDDGTGADSRPGTVNVLLGTTRALGDGALANLLTVATEAKTATLLAATGFPGTTTDAAIAGTDPDGDPARFSGSATEVGASARACVRDAVLASLESRYADRSIPTSVAAAEHGVVTDRRASVFQP